MNSLYGVKHTPPQPPSVRRSSSGLVSSPHGAMHSQAPLSPQAEESQPTLPVTSATVARDYLRKDLELHNGEDNTLDNPEVVVILNDACYGHRFARPKTSKANLNTIVERPERIHATLLGLATAYVRLGGRYTEDSRASHAKPTLTTVKTTPFRIVKSSRLMPLASPAVTNVHGIKWMQELKIMCDNAEAKLALGGKELARPAGPSPEDEDLERPKLHEGDLYLCSESLGALEGSLGGVCDAVDTVFREAGPKRAFVCVRPPGHHCSTDYPSGFCWLNNVHVGISHASLMHGLTHAAIIDFDLHHGDGSQNIAWFHNAKVASMPKNTPLAQKSAIGYFSLHDINSYPCEYGDEEKIRNASVCIDNAHGQTIWNVHLQPWKSEAEFWELYVDRYSVLLNKARNFLRAHSDKLRLLPNHPKPKAAVFISAGFDASEWESPGMQRHEVNVPTDFYARFTQDITALASEDDLGVDGRIISVLEGGYSDRALTSGVLSHLCGLTSSTNVQSIANTPAGLGQEMRRRLGGLNINSDVYDKIEPLHVPYDPKWWALPCLEELETLVKLPVAPFVSKKPRGPVAPTYTTPTQSYTAKVVTSPHSHRSFSGPASIQRSSSSASSRASSPPAPEVDWATASHELCKLLIPADRPTKSFKPEELHAEASRARRDRHSTTALPMELPVVEGKRMQLRDRKTRTPNHSLGELEVKKAVLRSTRRKTMVTMGTMEQKGSKQPDQPGELHSGNFAAPSRRRLSMASTVGSTNVDLPYSAGPTIPGEENNVVLRVARRRSSSSSSNRPSSTMSNPLEAVKEKKFRGASRSRHDASNPRIARKPPQVPPIPSSNLKSSIPKDKPVSPLAAHIAEAPVTGSEDRNSQDLEKVTLGMKKISIKLNVTPKLGTETAVGKKKPAFQASPNLMATKAIQKEELRSITQPKVMESLVTFPDHKTEPANIVLPAFPVVDHTSDFSAASHPPELLSATPTYGVDLEPLPASVVPPVFDVVLAKAAEPSKSRIKPSASAISPDRHTDLPAHASFQTDTILPQTNNPQLVATPKRTRNDLPVFTATSPIVFRVPNLPPTSTSPALTSEVPDVGGRILLDQNDPTKYGRR